MSSDTEKLLTPDQVADQLSVSTETVRKLMVSGKLPWVSVGTGESRQLRRVRPSTLAAYQQNERRAAIKQQMHDVRTTLRLARGVPERW